MLKGLAESSSELPLTYLLSSQAQTRSIVTMVGLSKPQKGKGYLLLS